MDKSTRRSLLEEEIKRREIQHQRRLEKQVAKEEEIKNAIPKAEHGEEYSAELIGKEYAGGRLTELDTAFDRWIYDNSSAILEFAVGHKDLTINVPDEHRERFSRLLDNRNMSDAIGLAVEKDDDIYEAMDLRSLQELSDKQDSKAVAELAYRYDEGLGVEQDNILAHELYLKAASLGNPWAEYAVGWNYENGCGVECNLDLARKWYGEAGVHGHAEAYEALCDMKGIMCGEAIIKICYDGLYFAKKAINLGGYDHAYQLGCALVEKTNNCKRMGFVCFIYSVIRGSVSALNRLGSCYLNNLGVPFRDYEKAVYYYRLAAQKGDMYGMHNLALCYEWGYGVRKNLGTAAVIYKNAATMGHKGAAKKYDELYVKLHGNVPDNVPELLNKTVDRNVLVSHKDITELHKNVIDYYEAGKYADAAHNMRNVLERIVGYFVSIYASESVNDTIFDKIKVLEESAQIDRHYIEIMHAIRVLGNRGAHLEEEPEDMAEDIRLQLEPLNDLVNYYNGFH